MVMLCIRSLFVHTSWSYGIHLLSWSSFYHAILDIYLSRYLLSRYQPIYVSLFIFLWKMYLLFLTCHAVIWPSIWNWNAKQFIHIYNFFVVSNLQIAYSVQDKKNTISKMTKKRTYFFKKVILFALGKRASIYLSIMQFYALWTNCDGWHLSKDNSMSTFFKVNVSYCRLIWLSNIKAFSFNEFVRNRYKIKRQSLRISESGALIICSSILYSLSALILNFKLYTQS